MGRFFIGTSGYNYKDWMGVFYPKDLPQKEWLRYYSKHFNTVEINATFYRNFPRFTFEKWYQETGKDFKFCLKGSRFITHIKRLEDVESSIELFFDSASGLKKKLNKILWQFPSNFKLNEENKKRLKNFLEMLKQVQHDEYKNVRHAFEFRDGSWFKEEVFDLLDREKAGFVISDSPIIPSREVVTGDFAYIRFHGPVSLYSSSYSDKELKTWAKKIKKYLKNFDVYCYFNNDVSGYAVKNALTLRKVST